MGNVKMLNVVSLDGDAAFIKKGGGGVSINNQDKVVDIVENGTTAVVADAGYTGLGKVTVNVDVPTSGGGAIVEAPLNEVNFFDFDGTLLHSYTWEEALAMTELPPLPERAGLICQGWNYTLDDIKAQNGKCDVGATYITDDGKTRLYIRIAAEGRMDVPLNFQQWLMMPVTVDWGDGNVETAPTSQQDVSLTHHYDSIGDYCITLTPPDKEGASVWLGVGTTSTPVLGSMQAYSNMLQKVEMGRNSGIGSSAFKKCHSLTSITIPNNVTSISSNVFYDCYSLSSVVIPSSVTSIGSYAFYDCYSLSSVVIPSSKISFGTYIFTNCYSLSSIVVPSSVTSIFNSGFSNCYSLSSVVIPSIVTMIAGSAFYECHSLTSVVIPSSVTSIGKSTFGSCSGIAFYDFSSHGAVPTILSINAFSNIPSDCKIIVPDALYDEWIAATNWATYADYIIKKSDWDAL